LRTSFLIALQDILKRLSNGIERSEISNRSSVSYVVHPKSVLLSSDQEIVLFTLT